MGHARTLLSVDSLEQQLMLAREITARELSVRETEQLVKRTHVAASGPARKKADVINNTEAANVLAAEAKLSKKLGAPVKIRLARTGGVVEIKFSSNDDLARLFDTLMQSRYNHL
jgi:ParB family transcriptional regulator, chromosome partitioning protein